MFSCTAPAGTEGKPLLGGFHCSRQASPPAPEPGNWRSTARKDAGCCFPHNPCKAEAAAHTPSKPSSPGDQTPLQKEKRKRLQRHCIAPGASIQPQRGVPDQDRRVLRAGSGEGGQARHTSSGPGYSTSDGQQQQPPTICHRIQGHGVTPAVEEPIPPQEPPQVNSPAALTQVLCTEREPRSSFFFLFFNLFFLLFPSSFPSR